MVVNWSRKLDSDKAPCFVLLEDRTLQVDYGAGAPAAANTSDTRFLELYRPGD